MTSTQFDVFLSHNSRDKPAVERVAILLKQAGLKPWLDRWHLLGGDRWQQALGDALRASAACAVFYGSHGLGDWQQPELDVAQDRAIKDANFRLIPVLLPGTPEQFEPTMLPPFLSMLMWVDLRQGIEDPARLAELIAAIQGFRGQADENPAQTMVSDVPPYQGLRTFDEDDAEFFYGREADVQRLLEKLKGSRFLAVVGASGSGKSSLVRAGLLPALRNQGLPNSGQWQICVFKPGAHPLTSLAAYLGQIGAPGAMQQTLDQLESDPRTLHLAASLGLVERPADARLLLLIDQFEEVFTLCRDEAERAAFLANLVYAAAIPDGRCVVVLTLRADFYPRCAAYPELASRLGTDQFLVSPLAGQGLRDAITKPAARVGLVFDPGLVERILRDVQSQPGALPLLEHALLEMWERRRGRTLTLAAYEDIGGVAGALAKRADASFEALTSDQQAIARLTMLRLTQPGEGTEDTRRRAELDELAARPDQRDEVQQVVDALVAARLLTTSGDPETGAQWVDVAHEALIRGWPRLRQWLEEDRQGLIVHRRLTEAAHDWQMADHDSDLLYRGARLVEAQALAARHGEALNEFERQFLTESEALRERERAALEAARMGRERARRRTLAGLAAFSVVALVLAGFALWQWQEARIQTTAAEAAERTAVAETGRAETEAARAETEARVALSRQLAAQSRAHTSDLDLGLLLAAEAYDLNPDDLEVRRSLLAATYAQLRLDKFLHGQRGNLRALAFSPDGTTLASGSDDGTIHFWDPRTGEAADIPSFGGSNEVWDVAFRPDGRQVAIASAQVLQLWDPITGTAGPTIESAHGLVASVAYSPEGTVLASSTAEGVVEFWDPETGAAFGPPLRGHEGEVHALAFSSDGSTLVSAGIDDGTIRFWNVSARRLAGEPIETDQGGISQVSFSPDGLVLATAGGDGTVRLWDAASRLPIGEPLSGHGGSIQQLAFSPDGTRLFSAGGDGSVWQWAVTTRRPIGEPIAAGQGPLLALALSPDGTTLATGGGNGTLRLWDVTAQHEPFASLMGHSAISYAIAYSPDGSTIATGGDDGSVVLWNAEDGSQIGAPLLGHADRINSLAFGQNGKVLASASWDGTARLWDLASDEAQSVLLIGHGESVSTVAFSPHGDILATGADDETVRLWRASDGASLGDPLQTRADVMFVRFSPDGTALAAADVDGAIHLWNTESREPLLAEPIRTDQGVVRAICFVRDGSGLATAGEDGTIHYWNASDGSMAGPPTDAHSGSVRRLACDSDGSRLVSSGDDGRVMLWQVFGTIPEEELLEANEHGWQEVAFSPDGSRLAFTSADRPGQSSINLWDVTGRRLTRAFPILNVLQSITLSSDGSRIVTGSEDGRITVWEASDGAPIAEQRVADGGGVWRIAVSPDGSQIAVGSASGTVRLWDGIASSPVSDPVAQHDEEISALAFSGDGTLLASGAEYGTVQVWNTETRQPMGAQFVYTNTLTGLPESVRSLAFSPDGSLLAVGGFRTTTLWDLAREEVAGPPLAGHRGFIISLAFSPDGRLLASGGEDREVRLWDTAAQRVLPEQSVGSSGKVDALTFNPDGSLLAAGTATGSITVWELSAGAVSALGQVKLVDAPIQSLAFTTGGASVASLDADGAVSHLDLSTEAWRQRACTIANRNLTRGEWAQYIGDPGDASRPYQATCPELPLPVAAAEATPTGATTGTNEALPATPVVPAETE